MELCCWRLSLVPKLAYTFNVEMNFRQRTQAIGAASASGATNRVSGNSAVKDARMHATFSAEAVASAADPPLPIRAMTQLKLDGHGSSSSCFLFHVAVLLHGYAASHAVAFIATSRLRLRCAPSLAAFPLSMSLSLPPPLPPPPSLSLFWDPETDKWMSEPSGSPLVSAKACHSPLPWCPQRRAT